MQAEVTNFDVERGEFRTMTDKKAMTRRTADLLFAVSQRYSSEVAESVVNHYGDLCTMSRWEQAEMDDDLISKLNDTD